ncbi:MAG: penicillin-binding protein activator LpoB [Gemmatimonadetes bacterium]|nr:penicillin-binding protein activator LpoB [Gemmatimonadota bacterium]
MTRSGRAIPALMLALLAIGATTACGKRVSRIDPTAVTDLSGRWNDTDSRLVANELITQSMNGPWLTRYTNTNGGEAPAVIVGSFRNRTLEHIPVNTFIGDLERAMINSGGVRMVASTQERAEIRGEREDQQENARADTRARMAQELGANYMLQGEITAIEDQEGREKVVYYQIDATLTDLESNVRVWAGQHKIKKYIERARIGW